MNLKNLNLLQKVAQCVFPRLNVSQYESDVAYKETIVRLAKLGCGGFCIFGGNIESVKKTTAELQFYATIPLLFCADFEHGLPMRLEDGTAFPHHLALAKANKKNNSAANNWTAQTANAIAKEAKAVGVLWNLAPVCDINSNPKNPVINIRAFGNNKEDVTKNATIYINATQSENVIACAKHFPGHGDTATDSHARIPLIDKSIFQLEDNELIPFVEAMRCDVKSIMLGHLALSSVENKELLPASMSPAIVQYLRQINIAEEGQEPKYWEGIIITDALDMQAVLNITENSAYSAFVAGVDVLLMPPNPEAAIQFITTKIEQSKNDTLLIHLEKAIKRIHKLKHWTKLLPRFSSANVAPQLFIKHAQLALVAAYNAIDIISQDNSYLPVPEDIPFAAFSIMQRDEDLQAASRFFTMLAQAVENDCDYGYLDENISEEQLEDMSLGIVEAEFLVFALFYRGRGYSNQLASVDKINNIIKTLASGRDYIIVCFGDPYIADKLDSKTKILTYSDSFASLAAAVMFLSGRNFS